MILAHVLGRPLYGSRPTKGSSDSLHPSATPRTVTALIYLVGCEPLRRQPPPTPDFHYALDHTLVIAVSQSASSS